VLELGIFLILSKGTKHFVVAFGHFVLHFEISHGLFRIELSTDRSSLATILSIGAQEVELSRLRSLVDRKLLLLIFPVMLLE
jgi:hypothetical protein